MKRTILLAGAIALAAPVAAAERDAPPTPQSAGHRDAGKKDGAAKDDAAKERDLSADMAATLRKAGFTDLKIMPNAIIVRATNKDGRPVVMALHPGSMTEVVTLDPHSGSSAAGNGAKPLTGESTFVPVLPTQRLASTLVGLKVRNAAKDEIGTIKDIAIDHDGVHAYILAAGGILGIGNRYVAVAPKAVDIAYEKATNTYSATMNATSEQLKAAPDFAYEGPLAAGRN